MKQSEILQALEAMGIPDPAAAREIRFTPECILITRAAKDQYGRSVADDNALVLTTEVLSYERDIDSHERASE